MPLCVHLPLLVAADMIPHLDDVIAATTGRALKRARACRLALHSIDELAPEQGAANVCSSFAAMSAHVYSRSRLNGYTDRSRLSGWRWQPAWGVRSAISYHLRVKRSCRTFLFSDISNVNDARATGALQTRLCRRLWRHFPASRRPPGLDPVG